MVALSVVVPIYNVERYLDECLRSLRAQTWTDLEVVMVDDGSKDGSADIAARFAREDPRFKLVQQENGGLGAARNTGARHATGEFLTFVDSDDIIPPYAFGYHLHSLRRSGSDFSSGNVHLLSELDVWQSPMHREIFLTTRTRTHVTREDSLLVDRLATNKVWRRSFWDRQGMSFPVGVLYEDEAVVVPLHFLAKSVDVLSEPVYLWRQRPSDDRSITQDRFRPRALEDRFTAVTAVSDFIVKNLGPQEKRRWDEVALGRDLRAFVQVLDQADDGFMERFLDLAATYLATVDPRARRRMSAIERLKWHLIGERRAEQVRQVVAFSKGFQARQARTVRHGVRFYGDYPFKDDPAVGVPRRVYRLDTELELRQKTDEMAWRDGKLVIRGRVCLRFLRPNKRIQQHVSVWAVNGSSGRRVRLPVSVHRANEFRFPPDLVTSRQDWGGYEITVDPRSLRVDGGWEDSEWHIELGVLNRGFRRSARLAVPGEDSVRRIGPAEVASGVWVRPRWFDAHELRLHVDRAPARFTGHELRGSEVVLTGELPDGVAADTVGLRLARDPGDTEIAVPVTVEGRTFHARVRLDELTAGYADRVVVSGAHESERWQVWFETPEGAKQVTSAQRLEPARHRFDGLAVLVGTDFSHRLHLRVERESAVITSAAWEGRDLLLSGQYQGEHAADPSFLLSATGRMEERAFPVETEGAAFRVRLTPTAIPLFGQTLPLASGSYEFFLRWDEESGPRDVRVELHGSLLPRLPLFLAGEGPQVGLEADGEGRPRLRADGSLRAEEQGSYAQQLLREKTYPALRGKPVSPGVLFDSYSGKQYSDSPRGICEELRLRGTEAPMSWLVKDRQVSLPEGLAEVHVSSREYYEALARSEYIVSNAHLPRWFDKRPGQKVVQTWHGSMLKRIGFDIEDVRFGNRDYHERLLRETGQWDYLVSPSPWATPILRSAFRYEGEILETGYPRNDLFHAPEREAVAERVRSRLGLPPGKRVVLYAPTWRDDKFYSAGKYKLDLRLDLARMHEALGEDHVLLVRRHPNIVDRVPAVGQDFVRDVSTYPEIQELFLVTDVLVTDYSSLMFDFANTGRPMLFFTYDLEEYRDNLRGFYFDFEETAPGPLLRTSDEVIEAIRGADEVGSRYKDRYEAFVDRFCPLDDGKAAKRIVDRVFPDLL
ncbi:CDP-glycerol--glycerophosphate glycerophosphotransferase [Nocardiopsis sp. TSRI0078]|uniref:bifunctional glycosyltransferase/CDP-glycerol:glycerophosphate glycerophosphotransferase n=1 Tax=unclassified Nocardiopsis TaxID=2649073 RepID=UPI00093B89BF|nr:bifunctional glycosyltransferase family 2 protein/CDP-glycerol:glycerophosphate glycerophosphotransferase [Nocardiopsis sp. TSRI0078]OKI23303.1 CDP-glycerol--glycerophosphate glycerophosphotransferase [Nocardiopsis sp. TSRI0078]